MLVIGLTGSIATGKSTVSNLLSSAPHNIPLIDADVLARTAVAPGTKAYRQIIARFASTTPDLLLLPFPPPPDSSAPKAKGGGDELEPRRGNELEPRRGSNETTTTTTAPRPLDRAALGRRVFGNDAARRADRAALNGIVHPAVRRAMAKSMLRAWASGAWAVVLDVPLLYEAGIDIFCGVVVVVGVHDPAVQMRRLRARDPHLSETDAADRVGSQMGIARKVRRCERSGGVVVWNDEDGVEGLRAQVDALVLGFKRSRPRWWSMLLWLVPPVAIVVGAWCVVGNWWVRRRWLKEEEEEEEEDQKKEGKTK
ncbi:MAG: hypothetical protein M1825_001665 [Sarcosagium campestre]|nr:MAG: hypothetical protein M1825_001665 [Sarcosagium campestre]